MLLFFCHLNHSKLKGILKEVIYRKVKSIDIVALRGELDQSDLCNQEHTDLQELSLLFNSTLLSLLDKQAPVLKKTIITRKRVPWFNNEIKAAIRSRRKADWRLSKSEEDFNTFKSLRNRATYLMNRARCEYYTNYIQEHSDNQRKFFQTTMSLLCEPKIVEFPLDIHPDTLADGLGEFLVQKIENINNSLNDTLAPSTLLGADTSYVKSPPTDIKPLTTEDVKEFICRISKKSCQLDPMPMSLILQLLDVLFPVIYNCHDQLVI